MPAIVGPRSRSTPGTDCGSKADDSFDHGFARGIQLRKCLPFQSAAAWPVLLLALQHTNTDSPKCELDGTPIAERSFVDQAPLQFGRLAISR
jgi:hypothetical protein